MANSQKDPALRRDEIKEISLPVTELTELLQATLQRGAPLKFRATGFSMDPFIRDGDMITLSAFSGVSPRFGDVVAFVQKGSEALAIHRVVGRKKDAYLIKGDNAIGTDGPIPRAKILGFVSRVEREGKKVLLGLGPERFLIALLTGQGLTIPLVRLAFRLLQFIRKKPT
jgi:signal peptidase I